MSKMRILVVDDDVAMLDAVCRMLAREGHEVVRATNPRQALQIVRNNGLIHAVVSDNVMPEMQGTQLLREVVQLSPQTARLLMTGSVIKSTEIPDGVIVLKKPFSRRDLIAAVRSALAQSGE
jgi:DNA-binding NtrC family response regulator